MKTNKWETSDFYSAVIVRANGVPLADLTKKDGKFVTFQFSDSPEVCEAILKKHWDRTLKLETRLFIETINELKTRVHETLKKDGYGKQ